MPHLHNMNYVRASSNPQTTPYMGFKIWPIWSETKLYCSSICAQVTASLFLTMGLVVRAELTLSTILLHSFPVLWFLIIYSGDKLTIQKYGAIQLKNYQADIMYGPRIKFYSNQNFHIACNCKCITEYFLYCWDYYFIFGITSNNLLDIKSKFHNIIVFSQLDT
jgi:hypothetical protein